MAVERMGPDFVGLDPPKSLQCASSTTLVAALDPALKGTTVDVGGTISEKPDVYAV